MEAGVGYRQVPGHVTFYNARTSSKLETWAPDVSSVPFTGVGTLKAKV